MRQPGPVQKWGWLALAGLASAQVIVLHVVFASPLITNHSVGAWPVINLLSMAYLVPAMFAAAFYVLGMRGGDKIFPRYVGVLALLLLFVDLNLEVRHWYQGPYIGSGVTTNAEWYAYSIAWLAAAGLLLFAGIWRQNRELRLTSLGLVLITVTKVFLFDLAELEGLYRAGSFVALGGCLVAIGYVYRRYLLAEEKT